MSFSHVALKANKQAGRNPALLSKAELGVPQATRRLTTGVEPANSLHERHILFTFVSVHTANSISVEL